MQDRRAMLLATLALGMFVGVSGAQTPQESPTFPAGIILIGARRLSDPDACTIEVISPAGVKGSTIFRRESGSIVPGARLNRQGDRLVCCCLAKDGKGEFLMVKSKGEATKLLDGVGLITAWSPDGRQLAFYQDNPVTHLLESFVIDLTTREQTKLQLDVDCVAEDWHPSEDIRTVIYMNPRNRIYRERKGDSYPTRQLDFLTVREKRTPITKNPATDNIWSRFSPKGDRLAYYSRCLVGEKPLESAVVCGADGTQPKDIFGFTEFGEKVGLDWFRPDGPPTWSPDGLTLIWRISTNAEPTSDGEKHELLFMDADGGNPRRLPLAEIGLQWVSAIEWR